MSLSTPAFAFVLGWTAGLRSASAPALLSRALAGGRRPRPQPARALSSRHIARLLTVAAAGEMVVDKLPGVPARTSPPALGARIVSGALVGAAVAGARRASRGPSALAGAVGAVAGSFAGLYARQSAGEAGVPDGLAAVVEDVFTVLLGGSAAQVAVRR